MCYFRFCEDLTSPKLIVGGRKLILRVASVGTRFAGVVIGAAAVRCRSSARSSLLRLIGGNYTFSLLGGNGGGGDCERALKNEEIK